MTRPPPKKRSKKKEKEPGNTLPPLPLQEILAVVLAALGIFLALAILWYRPTDPSFNQGGDAGAASNLMGPVGAYVADALVGPLGIPAILVPLLLLYGAALIVRPSPVHWPFLRLLAGGAFVFFVCLLLAIYPETLAWHGSEVQAGGWLGRTFEDALEEYFNQMGTFIVVSASALIAFMVTFSIEISPLVRRLGGWLSSAASGTARATASVVTVGASKVGQAASAGASAMSTRLKQSAAVRREPEEEDEEDEEEAVAPVPGRDKRPPPIIDRHLPSQTLPKARVPIPAAPAVGAPMPRPPATLVSSPSHIEEDVPEDDFEDDGPGQSMEDEDMPPPPDDDSPRGKAAGKGKSSWASFGPRIIKSRYMEEGASQNSVHMPEPMAAGDYVLPFQDFLTRPVRTEGALSEEQLIESARTLEAKLKDYGVEGRVVEIHPGPVITMYEYSPAPGVKVAKITNLANDLALALKAVAVRIIAPLPGKAAVGIEVPSPSRQTVYLREVIEHDEFKQDGLRLPMAIGKDIEGKPYATDLAKMPHLLVAGATGTGKSVAVNAMLISVLYSRTPEEVRLILVDPKIIEFSVYDNIPHLLMPVVTDPHKAARALNWAVNEMTNRYKLLTREGARNIASYNKLIEKKLETLDPHAPVNGGPPLRKLPYIIIVIDELADLMMVAGKEVQDAIVRLAQMARAAGIHMIVATQRPSVDVITGLIKANFPARIAFKVSSKTDSRTILDANGAECLLGMGDMLFVPPGSASLLRLHGAFVSDDEARKVIDHLRKQGTPYFDESILNSLEDGGDDAEEEAAGEHDEFYEQAKRIVLEAGMASISTIQRKLKIGYNRSARMVERMAKEGLIGPPTQGGKPRDIYTDKLRASLR